RQRVASLPPDDWRTRSLHFNEPLLTRNLEIAERVSQIAKRLGLTPGHLAIAWVLSNPAVTGAIVGIRSTQQAEDLAKALEVRPEDYAHDIEALTSAPSK
ncbi:MAG: aldo/keto reductase, partial [Pirellula sp.]